MLTTMQYYTHQPTPAGRLLFVGDGQTVTGIHWIVFRHAPLVQPDWIEDAGPFREAIRQLDEYFAGGRTEFSFRYELRGTPFQQVVWRELERIPYGTASSYRQIAQIIGRPQAVRAVGTAVGRNPLSIVLPCHRVLTSASKLGGYAGGLPSKRYLLEKEQIGYVDVAVQ
jgi:methylated-DNA-[protein]-cysteine S-methyltransferase